MKKNKVRHPFWLFAAPLTWFSLYGITELLGTTTWGISGDPSNGIVIFLYLMLSAPLLGILGIVYALFYKASPKFYAKAISIVLNLCIIIGGIGFWFWWFK